MLDLTNLPKDPGCYLYKDINGNIIYIGKAKNLSKRVKSYFQKKHDDEKTNLLVKQIKEVDFFITDNEVEALILENNLIKKHQPKYNINLKDDRRYAYIEITDEKYPRLILARQRNSKGEFFGPFVSGLDRNKISETLIKGFGIRTCNKLPKRACLRYHIKLCSAPCINNISKKDYDNNVKNAKSILKGKTKEILKSLSDEMLIASKKQNYETALEKKRQIDSLNYLYEKQNVQRKKSYDEDIINYIIKNEKVYLIVFNIHEGILENKQEFEFNLNPDFFEEFIIRYYSENKIPKELIVPKACTQALIDFLSKLKKSKVKINVPKIGEKKDLLNLVKKNIEISFFKGSNNILELKKELKLNFTPSIIECFDISHLSGKHTVASMVQFKDGLPSKANYRKFKLKTVNGIDDFLSMKEVIKRRYSHLKNNNIKLPDLILIDGGKGQLSSALEVLENLNLRIPIISLAKRIEEIFVPGKSNPILLNHKSNALKLLQSIRDEAHRFAITYNRLLRKKEIRK